MDNRYYSYGCPALMQDARFITNYIDSRIFEQTIRGINKIKTAQEYRQFLQDKAETLMEKERKITETLNSCSLGNTCMPLS